MIASTDGDDVLVGCIVMWRTCETKRVSALPSVNDCFD
jgi:hypothetical protein